MNPALVAIQPKELGVICFLLPAGLHTFFSQYEPVLKVREAYKNGELTSDEIRQHVDVLLDEFKTGIQFEGDETLAAISVALEPIRDKFTTEYIDDLASLHVNEMPISPRVARICQENRRSKEFDVSTDRGTIKIAAPTYEEAVRLARSDGYTVKEGLPDGRQG